MEARMNEDVLREQIVQAREAGKRSLRELPRAEDVDFQERERMLAVELQNGTTLRIPVDELQGLSGAAAADIEEVEVAEDGLALHWDKLDVHFTVPGLVKGLRGTSTWMKAIGQKGGQAKSADKGEAARANGRRGGRPRKQSPASHFPPGKTVTKRALIGQIADDTGIEEADVRAVIDDMLRLVRDSVKNGKKVQLTGFGAFELRERKARSGVRPGSGTRIELPSQGPIFLPDAREFGYKRTKK
jgi:nucleoid DNA-binding protein